MHLEENADKGQGCYFQEEDGEVMCAQVELEGPPHSDYMCPFYYSCRPYSTATNVTPTVTMVCVLYLLQNSTSINSRLNNNSKLYWKWNSHFNALGLITKSKIRQTLVYRKHTHTQKQITEHA